MILTKRQHEIIDAAGKLLTVSGLSGLTVKNLAREMQFAESALYRHFKSKEEIIVTMLQYLAEDIDQRLKKIEYTPHPDENLRLLFREQFRFFQANPHFVVAVFSDGLMDESQKINENILNLIDTKTRHLTPVITDGQQKGIFTDKISSDRLVSIIMGAFKLEMFKWRTARFNYSIVAAGEEMITAFLVLIKK